ncbi:multidrug efflux SMR transporter [Umezawaea sp. Da 62-37]|uniref:DMT family transporter n=1 Tax=Umezawaea sp. Da 62-37 TaxID=3075927 RepID=UPI0028F70D66|nr:multidrug efflux SMR transporter [Umezawaea sp. Da 62-37]WNV91285.1 multidrug efflux SMR transporter [Umezawaea sp. Da 62-37]
MLTYLIFAVAVLGEVAATVSLKVSAGFTRPVPTVIVVVGYLIAFTALAKVLERGMPIGLAYAVWSAFGIAAIAGIGAVFFGERLTPTMVVGLALVICGVITIELGSAP